MNAPDLRAWMRAALESCGVQVGELPVELVQAVLGRLQALDAVDASGEEPGPLRWQT